MVAFNLLSAHSQLYTLWDEEDSDEPEGCRLAEVTLVIPDRTGTVLYHKGETYETVNFDEVSWFPGSSRKRSMVLTTFPLYTLDVLHLTK